MSLTKNLYRKLKRYRNSSAKKTAKSTFGGFTVSIVLVILTILILISYAGLRLQFHMIGFEISEATKTNQQLTDLNKKLRLEVATLSSPSRIERIAKEKLDLEHPKPQDIIVIKW